MILLFCEKSAREREILKMNAKTSIITKVEFFDASYKPMRANVSPRGFSSLSYRKSGRISIETGDVSFVSEPGTLTFVPHGYGYFTEVFEAGEMILLHFWTEDGSPDVFDKPTLISPRERDTFLNIFAKGIKHSLSGAGYSLMADAYRLLSEIEKEAASLSAAPPQNMLKVKEYIDSNLDDPELRVAFLAEKYGTSEVYFRREFKKYFTETPLEYVKRKRIELACNLISTELYSITDVATRSGFDSISYFSSEFKRITGVSPREYRRT